MSAFWIIVSILYVIITHVIAKYIGETRQIGYGKSVFFSVLLSPIVGYFITKWSKPLDKEV